MREIKFRAWFITHKRMFSSYEFMGMSGFVDFLKNKTIFPMQFTGLLDKNGKEIWEGDIVCMEDGGSYGFKHEVLFKQGMFCVEDDGTWFPIGQFYSVTEVIGNIYNNPELLEK